MWCKMSNDVNKSGPVATLTTFHIPNRQKKLNNNTKFMKQQYFLFVSYEIAPLARQNDSLNGNNLLSQRKIYASMNAKYDTGEQ